MTNFQIKMLKRCARESYKLDQWEKDFITNLGNKPADYELSSKQNHKLNEINGKV